MIYRFTLGNEIRQLLRVPAIFEITAIPARGRWPRNWEWTYDFPDLWRDIGWELRYLLFLVVVWALRKSGAVVRKGQPEYSYKINYAEVNTDRVADAIFKKLSEYQRQQLYEGAMILVGPGELDQLRSLEAMTYPGMFTIQGKYWFATPQRWPPDEPYDVRYYLCDIPVVYLPDFVGIAVVPDFAKLARKRAI